MKKASRVMLVIMAVVMLVSLVSCGSKFGTIKKNLEAAGWEYIKADDADTTTKTMIAELEEGNLECTIHLFSKATTSLGIVDVHSFAIILEFGSDKALEESLSESETLKGMVADAQNSKYVNGNCFCIPVSLTAVDEILEAFGK